MVKHLQGTNQKPDPVDQPTLELLRALFTDGAYLELHPDVAGGNWDGLDHYISHGEAEGRAAHPLFEPEHYAAQASHCGSRPLVHYLAEGWKGGHAPHPLFDPDYYVRQAPEAVGKNPLLDYMSRGRHLHLSPC